MSVRHLFATRLYEAELGEPRCSPSSRIRSARSPGRPAGRRWSREHGYPGYTSYASLNDLPRRDPAFADLAKLLTRHARAFADGARVGLAASRSSTACGSIC